MNNPRCAVVLVISCINLFGFMIGTQMANAGYVAGQKCITSLNPATCSNAANSACNTYAGEGGACDGTAFCTWCDSSNGVGTTFCNAWAGANCFVLAGPPSQCSTTANVFDGTCGIVNNTCLCQNPVANGQCGNNFSAFPCM